MVDADPFAVFLSGVSSEFKSVRRAIASDLRANGWNVKEQQDFRTGNEPDKLLARIHDYIRGCSIVICLIGIRSGDIPPLAVTKPYKDLLPLGVNEASYTQWEYFFARHYQKQIQLFFSQPVYPLDQPITSTEDHSELQNEFVSVIKQEGWQYSQFKSNEEIHRLLNREIPSLVAFSTSLRKLLRARSERLMDDMRASHCRWETFVDRPELSEPLFRFASGKDKDQDFRGMLIAGHTGSGKSALLTNLTKRILDHDLEFDQKDIISYLSLIHI